jgi:hypothetical protein
MPKVAEFIKNKRGKTIRVVLSIREYERILDELEELDAIRAYDAAKSTNGTPIPYRQYRERRLKGRA